jgi:hypothetical protein
MSAQFFHAERQRGVTKVRVTFRSFANSPENGKCVKSLKQRWTPRGEKETRERGEGLLHSVDMTVAILMLVAQHLNRRTTACRLSEVTYSV